MEHRGRELSLDATPPAACGPAAARLRARHLPPLLVWCAAWALMLALDGVLDLANQALLLVLASALAALWWSPAGSLLSGGVAILAFNFAFVPPRGTFRVDLHHDALLLATMVAVSGIVALLMARQRRLAATERRHAQRAEQLRSLSDLLRAADDPRTAAPRLVALLSGLSGRDATLWLPADAGAPDPRPGDPGLLGPADAEACAGLGLCLRSGQAQGPGTGRDEAAPRWLLPLRGRDASYGAARLPLQPALDGAADLLEHAQALCDQMGAGLERDAARRAAAQAHEAEQAQALRNTLLAAISHDHRTPLATILGAAGSLHDQGERLSPEQRQRLAATIVDEAAQLARLTDNTLQLARLGAGQPELHQDWESAEEIVGSVLRRMRRRDPAHRVKASVQPGLPLLRCDAVLLVQLLDNLVDNALRYGGERAPVEVLALRRGERLLLAVRDRGPGVPAAERERIFATFQRGPAAQAAGDGPARRGAGVGLAVCRAIAQAHGGRLTVRPRRQGGASFELELPLAPAPEAAPDPAPGPDGGRP